MSIIWNVFRWKEDNKKQKQEKFFSQIFSFSRKIQDLFDEFALEDYSLQRKINSFRKIPKNIQDLQGIFLEENT